MIFIQLDKYKKTLINEFRTNILTTCLKKVLIAIGSRRIVPWKIAPQKITSYLSPNPNPNPGGNFSAGDLPDVQFSVHR